MVFDIMTLDIKVVVSFYLEQTLILVNFLKFEHFLWTIVSWPTIYLAFSMDIFGSDPMFVIISEWVAAIIGFVFKWQWIRTFEWWMMIDFTASQVHLIGTIINTSFYSLSEFVFWADCPSMLAFITFEFTVFNEESTHSGAEVLFPPTHHCCIWIIAKLLSS